jgi:hypothetical protein
MRWATQLTVAYALCVDETPIKVGPAVPKAGRKPATILQYPDGVR